MCRFDRDAIICSALFSINFVIALMFSVQYKILTGNHVVSVIILAFFVFLPFLFQGMFMKPEKKYKFKDRCRCQR